MATTCSPAKARAIDFDDCGWGHFAYDIAVTQWYLRHRPDAETLREAFLIGYREIRPFDPAHEMFIDTYLAVRSLLMALYLADRADNPVLRQWAPRVIADLAGELTAYID